MSTHDKNGVAVDAWKLYVEAWRECFPQSKFEPTLSPAALQSMVDKMLETGGLIYRAMAQEESAGQRGNAGQTGNTRGGDKSHKTVMYGISGSGESYQAPLVLADHLEGLARTSPLSKESCEVCELAASFIRGHLSAVRPSMPEEEATGAGMVLRMIRDKLGLKDGDNVLHYIEKRLGQSDEQLVTTYADAAAEHMRECGTCQGGAHKAGLRAIAGHSSAIGLTAAEAAQVLAAVEDSSISVPEEALDKLEAMASTDGEGA